MKTSLALLLAVALAFASACGSQYTILDRSTIQVSDNARVSAQNLIAQSSKYPAVVQQLALAQEIYQQQIFLLKERRNKLRARRRTLDLTSFLVMAVTTLGIGVAAIATTDENDASTNLKIAGGASLGGMALGTGLQIAAQFQEDTSSVDAKIRQLELLYDTMVERLRQLALSAEYSPGGPGTADDTRITAEMGSAIESFITAALAINVKG